MYNILIPNILYAQIFNVYYLVLNRKIKYLNS